MTRRGDPLDTGANDRDREDADVDDEVTGEGDPVAALQTALRVQQIGLRARGDLAQFHRGLRRRSSWGILPPRGAQNAVFYVTRPASRRGAGHASPHIPTTQERIMEIRNVGVVSPGDMGSAIAKRINDRALAGRLGECGRQRAADFSVERMTDRTVEVYEAILGGAR